MLDRTCELPAKNKKPLQDLRLPSDLQAAGFERLPLPTGSSDSDWEGVIGLAPEF